MKFLINIDGININILNQVLKYALMMFFYLNKIYNVSNLFNETPLNIAEYNGYDEIKEILLQE